MKLLDALSSYAVVPMGMEHLDEVLEIERTSQTSPWSHEGFRHELEENLFSQSLVAVTRDPHRSVAAYCVFWVVFEQVQVQNIAVHPEHRRRGLGRHLLGRILDEARAKGCRSVVLEVRASNTPARRLYTSLGFRTVGRREDYYQSPREDAVLMELALETP